MVSRTAAVTIEANQLFFAKLPTTYVTTDTCLLRRDDLRLSLDLSAIRIFLHGTLRRELLT